MEIRYDKPPALLKNTLFHAEDSIGDVVRARMTRAHDQQIPEECENETASAKVSTPCEDYVSKTTGAAGEQHDESTRSEAEDGGVHTETNADDNSGDIEKMSVEERPVGNHKGLITRR